MFKRRISLIEILPIRPPDPSEKNIHSRGGRQQDKQRSIVILQLQDDPKRPFLRASDIAASAWPKDSKEYLDQSESFRGGTIRGHLSGQPDNKINGKWVGGRKQAWRVSSIQGTLTLEAYNKAAEIINDVCDRYEAYCKSGRMNVHFYYLDEDDEILECDFDIEPPPVFPDSHIPRPKEKNASANEGFGGAKDLPAKEKNTSVSEEFGGAKDLPAKEVPFTWANVNLRNIIAAFALFLAFLNVSDCPRLGNDYRVSGAEEYVEPVEASVDFVKPVEAHKPIPMIFPREE